MKACIITGHHCCDERSHQTCRGMRLKLLIPVYNDWTALGQLLEDLNLELFKANRRASVLIVDDGSSTPAPDSTFDLSRASGITSVEILHLRRNVGHQRAIA